MPFIEDWITHPMTIINRLHEKSPSTYEDDVRNYFQTHISKPDLYKEIPSINDYDNEQSLPSSCLVRFRAMIQDMADDEIYCTRYRVRSNDHQQIEIEKSAKYTDLFVCPPGYTVAEEEPPRENFSSRQCFSCIPIPNETQWVKEAYRFHFGEQLTLQKRTYSNLNNVEQLLSPLKRLKTTTMETNDDNNNSKEKTEKTESNQNDKNASYIVKVYDVTEEILLNTMVEFIGIYYDHSVIKADNSQLAAELDNESLSQRKTIHCIQYKKLSHINPLLHTLPNMEFNQISASRQYILSLFEYIFPNDKLLCEFLLLHLISRTYVRQPPAAYGKLSLNISHMSNEQFDVLEKLLEQILSLHSRLLLTVNTLNTTQLMPNKNLTADNENQLMRTPLQLPSNSHLLIDETKMECGQLTTLGVNNIKLIQDILRQQTLKYEFHVYQLDYDCDIRCLVVSSTKSILPCDVYIRCQTEKEVNDVVQPNLTKTDIDNIRRYLTYVGQQLELDQTINDSSSDINTHIQEDFVNMRKQKILTNLDDFHLLLVLARLETLSHGENVLTVNRWNEAKNLEFTRRQRMNS